MKRSNAGVVREEIAGVNYIVLNNHASEGRVPRVPYFSTKITSGVRVRHAQASHRLREIAERDAVMMKLSAEDATAEDGYPYVVVEARMSRKTPRYDAYEFRASVHISTRGETDMESCANAIVNMSKEIDLYSTRIQGDERDFMVKVSEEQTVTGESNAFYMLSTGTRDRDHMVDFFGIEAYIYLIYNEIVDVAHF